MNKKIKIFILLLIPLMFMLSISMKTVSADSGWDTDYDSGSSWDSDYDSGSSWDSDHDWDSNYDSNNSYHRTSHSSSNSETNEVYFVLTFIGILILGWVIGNIIRDSRHNKGIIDRSKIGDAKYNNLFFNEVTQEEANAVIPDFNIVEFKMKAYEMFKNIQIAWMNFDYQKLREMLTDELYNTYEMDLEALKVKNQKNVMHDFEQIFTKLVSLKKENNQYIATVIINAKFYDYIQGATGIILRGNPKRKVNNLYSISFVKSINEIKNSKCPKCGADVSGNVTGVCDYCKAQITFNEYDWVMSEKKKISQR